MQTGKQEPENHREERASAHDARLSSPNNFKLGDQVGTIALYGAHANSVKRGGRVDPRRLCSTSVRPGEKLSF